MPAQKILVLAPALACASHLSSIEAMLVPFFSRGAVFDICDPLETLSDLDNQAYYEAWSLKLAACLSQYDIVIGFSFGGVILQQNFALFEQEQFKHLPIILFSTPSFTDDALKEKLSAVIDDAKAYALDKAYTRLMQSVAYPNASDIISADSQNAKLSCERLVQGLTRVLTTDSTNQLKQTKVNYLHCIGASSALVNQYNVFEAAGCTLATIASAGMRVLQDNPAEVRTKLRAYLS